MNYYLCDNITWKSSLSLLKQDMEGQRVYSNLWQMTRDVLMLSLTLSALASGALLLFGLIKQGIDVISETTPAMESIADIVIFSLLCPAIFVVPLTWVLAYFGWYKNLRKIKSLLCRLIDSFPEAEDVKNTSPVSYTFCYQGQVFQTIFEEKGNSGTVSVARGNLILLLPYQDTKEDRSTDALFKEIAGFLDGKLHACFAMGEDYMLYTFGCRPAPRPERVRQAADTLLYLMERFNLQAHTLFLQEKEQQN